MKNLLNAIKAELQTDLTYVRDGDIYVTEDLRLVPDAVRFPAVGLKDGAISYAIETQNQEEDTLDVDIVAYVELRKPETSIMGDSSAGKKGVLDIITDVVTSLKGNTLSGQADVAVPVSETPSELLADENTAIQMKTITMRYSRYD
ncbi:MAG: hypothetical protein JRD89_10715 [Deltaproteobacteria bacterium]|nr:hypothetical protein [Deltaproteobacteria bacterium]